MDYDFASLCDEQMEKLQKRLKSLSKTNVKDYKIALNVINNEDEIEHRGETVNTVELLLEEAANKTKAIYNGVFNQIQAVLGRHL